MSRTIDFYFEFSSPYAYLASTRIDALAERQSCVVKWWPYAMGAAMKLTGARPLTDIPLVGDYATRDFARSARLLDVPFVLPDPFPVMSLNATRLFYWIADTSEVSAKQFAERTYRAVFVDGLDIADKPTISGVAGDCGFNAEAAQAALDDPAIKKLAIEATNKAIGAGVCGAPFFIFEGEPFWGHDRMSVLERWIETGGW